MQYVLGDALLAWHFFKWLGPTFILVTQLTCTIEKILNEYLIYRNFWDCSWRNHQRAVEELTDGWGWDGHDAVQSEKPKELPDLMVQKWRGDQAEWQVCELECVSHYCDYYLSYVHAILVASVICGFEWNFKWTEKPPILSTIWVVWKKTACVCMWYWCRWHRDFT